MFWCAFNNCAVVIASSSCNIFNARPQSTLAPVIDSGRLSFSQLTHTQLRNGHVGIYIFYYTIVKSLKCSWNSPPIYMQCAACPLGTCCIFVMMNTSRRVCVCVFVLHRRPTRLLPPSCPCAICMLQCVAGRSVSARKRVCVYLIKLIVSLDIRHGQTCIQLMCEIKRELISSRIQ